MGVLTFSFLVHSLIQRKSDVEYRKTKITRKLADLTAYAATVGNGGVSIGDLLSLPGSQLGRAMQYLGYAHDSAMQYMQQNEAGFINFYMQQMGQGQTPEQQQQMQEWIRRSLYEQGRDRAMQVETKNLKIEEDKLKQEKEKLDVLAQEIQQELEAAQKGRDAAIKDMAPKYVANG